MKSNDWVMARVGASIGVRLLLFQSFDAVAAIYVASESAGVFCFAVGFSSL
jgi:hypothetical protein